jgi:hypothetical protein
LIYNRSAVLKSRNAKTAQEDGGKLSSHYLPPLPPFTFPPAFFFFFRSSHPTPQPSPAPRHRPPPAARHSLSNCRTVSSPPLPAVGSPNGILSKFWSRER